MKRVLWNVLILVSAASCRPSTGDQLVDQVVAIEDPTATCVTVGGTTQIFKRNPMGPPAMLEAEKIKDNAARRAAAKIAIAGPTGISTGEQNSEYIARVTAENKAYWAANQAQRPARTFGKFSGDRCLTTAAAPAYSDNFAFVAYSNPGGGLGAYVFRRMNNDWEIVERVELGFW